MLLIYIRLGHIALEGAEALISNVLKCAFNYKIKRRALGQGNWSIPSEVRDELLVSAWRGVIT